MSESAEPIEIAEIDPAPSVRRPVAESDLQAMLDREKQARQAERGAREAAEARANAAEREAAAARGVASSEAEARQRAQATSLEGQIESAEGEIAALEGRLGQLLAEGNHAEAAKVQVAVGRATARVDRMVGQKEALAAMAAQPAAVPESAPSGAPRFDWSQYTPAQRRWINQHPEYLTDERLRVRLAGTHQVFISDGGEVDSPEYYEALTAAFDRHVGGAPPGRGAPAEQFEAEEPAATRPRAAALPVSRRGAPAVRPAGRGDLHLTADEREAADIAMSDIPEADYTVNGVTKPGRYRIYAESRERAKKGA